MLGVCLNHGAPLGNHGMASILLGAAARSSPATAQRRADGAGLDGDVRRQAILQSSRGGDVISGSSAPWGQSHCARCLAP